MTIESIGSLTATHITAYGDGDSFSAAATTGKTTRAASPSQVTVPASAQSNALADAPDKVAPTSQLQINVDAKTSQVVIQIKNGNTTEIIRKIPAEDVVEFAQSLDSPTGNIVKTKA